MRLGTAPRAAIRPGPDRRLVLALDRPLDLRLTLRPLLRGAGDPTLRLAPTAAWRATRTPDGPATLAIEHLGDRIAIDAWGPGADAALAAAPALIGWHDDASGFVARDPVVAAVARRLPGVRMARTGAILEALIPAILEQKVTGIEAFGAFRRLVRRYGAPAPGPFGLWLPPDAATVAALPYHAFHPLGVEQRRADAIRRAAARAARLDALVQLPSSIAQGRLASLPGIGPWTAAETASRAFGDPDAVSIGDFHLPNLVAWAFAREPRADDARMLELLEPYRGHRGRVVRLLEASGIRAPRYGPRAAPRSIAAI